MSRYLLATHVHVCRTDDYVVLLDLRRDRYLGLDAESDTLLSLLVEGWPVQNVECKQLAARAEAEHSATLRALVEHAVLVSSDQPGKPATPPDIEPPTDTLAQSYFTEPHRLSLRSITRFFWACLYAVSVLRFGRIAHTVAAVQVWRESARGGGNIEGAAALVAIFEALRPFVLAGRNSCMFDSLALLKFLHMHGVHPQWVFGVRTLPFGAHCWVQSGPVVFNDTPDRVTIFTPIMAV